MKRQQKAVLIPVIVIPSIVLSVILVVVYLSWLLFHNIFSYQEMPEHWQPLPLPNLQSPVELRVVYVENLRFESLTDKQLKKILNKTSELVLEHLNVQLVLEQQKKISIQNLFEYLPPVVKKHQAHKIISIKNKNDGLASFNKIRESISQQIKQGVNSQQSVIDYAKPYLVDKNEINNVDDLTSELAKTIIQRYQFWLQQVANDAKPILDASPYNQWIYWDSLGYGALPYDVIITNQLVASIEENGMPVHTSLRGGITGGSMTYNKNSKLGGFVFVSAFQIINDNQLMSHLREDETYTEEQKINYIAATITHELGHLLFHYAHPFNAQSCIMNPTPMLHYRKWFEELDNKACNALNSPMQQQGAAALTFNTQW